MTRMTGGEAVVRSLSAHSVSTVFGIPGAHNLAIYDALVGAADIKHVVARHEQGAAFMADGYARVSGLAGICICTTGPAALNTLASLGTALSDSSPVLCIASQIPAAGIGLNKGYLHECSDQLSCFRPVTKWSDRANTVASIPSVMKEAFQRMLSGRPGPVAVEVPCDVLDASDNVEIPEPTVVTHPKPDLEHLLQAAQLIAKAQRPVIWAGGGVIVSQASDTLLQLAERIQAPVFTTVLGKGAISDEHPLAAGSAILHPVSCEYLVGKSVPSSTETLETKEFFSGCDVMIAIGTRFTEEETDRWNLRLPNSLIHIDIDSNEINRNYPATVGVVGDARQSLQELNKLLDSMSLQNSSNRVEEVSELRKLILQDCYQLAPTGVELVKRLRANLPRETIIVSDLTLGAYWCRRLLDLYQPRTYVYPWGFCTLGFGVPAAIGAKLAQPSQPVVLLSGDGGFLFNCQELAVAVQFNVPIVILLFNDNAYGVLKPQQEVRYGRTSAVDLVNPDFMILARAFGLDGQRVESIDQLGLAVATAIASNQTTIIEVPLSLPLPVMEPAPRLLHQVGSQ